MSEPDITINGRRLTQAQAMTVRVALSGLVLDLKSGDSLGDDEYGREMARLYLERLSEIFELIGGSPNN